MQTDYTVGKHNADNIVSETHNQNLNSCLICDL